MIKSATSNRVRLQVTFEPYERFGSSGGIKTSKVSGDDLFDALKKMVDKMGVYYSSDEIEYEGYTAEEVLERLQSVNGDGCDYILSLKNLTTGETLIEGDYDYEEEDWDD